MAYLMGMSSVKGLIVWVENPFWSSLKSDWSVSLKYDSFPQRFLDCSMDES